jgi:small subunit ribosomal protein S9
MTETQSDKSAGKIAPGAGSAGAATSATTTDKNGAQRGYWWGTGRRKTSVARVRIRPGGGTLLINDRQLDDYFRADQDRRSVVAPLQAVGAEKTFDIFINVVGGGPTGQAGASMLGIARALRKYDTNYVQTLRDGGYLTRDPRMVERKKPGQSGARKRFQFSKR